MQVNNFDKLTLFIIYYLGFKCAALFKIDQIQFILSQKLGPRLFIRSQKLGPRLFILSQKLGPRLFIRSQKLGPRLFMRFHKLDVKAVIINIVILFHFGKVDNLCNLYLFCIRVCRLLQTCHSKIE